MKTEIQRIKRRIGKCKRRIERALANPKDAHAQSLLIPSRQQLLRLEAILYERGELQ